MDSYVTYGVKVQTCVCINTSMYGSDSLVGDISLLEYQ